MFSRSTVAPRLMSARVRRQCLSRSTWSTSSRRDRRSSSSRQADRCFRPSVCLQCGQTWWALVWMYATSTGQVNKQCLQKPVSSASLSVRPQTWAAFVRRLFSCSINRCVSAAAAADCWCSNDYWQPIKSNPVNRILQRQRPTDHTDLYNDRLLDHRGTYNKHDPLYAPLLATALSRSMTVIRLIHLHALLSVTNGRRCIKTIGRRYTSWMLRLKTSAIQWQSRLERKCDKSFPRSQ